MEIVPGSEEWSARIRRRAKNLARTIDTGYLELHSSERSSGSGSHKVFAKINVYMDHLVARCRERLKSGGYVIIEGELMNRDGRSEALTEVRARDLVFV